MIKPIEENGASCVQYGYSSERYGSQTQADNMDDYVDICEAVYSSLYGLNSTVKEI